GLISVHAPRLSYTTLFGSVAGDRRGALDALAAHQASGIGVVGVGPDRDHVSGHDLSHRIRLSAALTAAEQQLDQAGPATRGAARSEEHTSELQSRENLVCR